MGDGLRGRGAAALCPAPGSLLYAGVCAGQRGKNDVLRFLDQFLGMMLRVFHDRSGEMDRIDIGGQAEIAFIGLKPSADVMGLNISRQVAVGVEGEVVVVLGHFFAAECPDDQVAATDLFPAVPDQAGLGDRGRCAPHREQHAYTDELFHTASSFADPVRFFAVCSVSFYGPFPQSSTRAIVS